VRTKLKQAILYVERNPEIVKSIKSFPYTRQITLIISLEHRVAACRHPAQRRMEDLSLDIGDHLTGIGLVPAPVKLLGGAITYWQDYKRGKRGIR
jgi:hypothetical protein